MEDRQPLSFAEIAAVARQAGFTAAQAQTMAAIAMAESGGSYWAVGDNFAVQGATRNPAARYDRGLFQINSIHSQYDAAKLVSDPLYNAKAAYAIFKSQGLGAWSTYNNGAYKAFLGGDDPAPKASGASTTSSEEGGVAEPKSRQELLDYIAENYPNVYAVMSIDAEVKKLLLTAAEKEYSPAKLQAELSKTRWWRSTDSQRRQWDTDSAQDPATSKALLAQTRDEIATQARRLGVSLSLKDLSALALNVRRLGWSDQQVAEALAAHFRQRTAKPGTGTATVDQLRAQAADYGVQLSDHTLTVWAQRILGGNADPAGFTSYVVKQAQSLYPTIAQDISEGSTVRDYFDPYVQAASRVLGVNPEDVDLSDNKWRRALIQTDPKTGQRSPMSLDDWEIELRTNRIYGYDKSTNGKRETAAFAAQLAGRLGYA